MFFKAITFFRFPLSTDLDGLAAGLVACALKPVGPLELSSRGFVAPFGREHPELSHRGDDAVWLTLGGEDKVLPPAAIDKALGEAMDRIFAREGRRPGGRARRRLREELVQTMLPHALVKPSRLDAMLDLRHGFVAVDSSSRKTAEGFVSEVRRALGSFPALPLNAEVAPRSVLTGWLAGEPLPAGVVLGEDCNLVDAADDGSAVKCYRVDLRSEEVAEHLKAGRQVTRLALVLDDHVSLSLDENLTIYKLKLLDGAIDALDTGDCESLHDELSARFALMTGEVRRLFQMLEQALKLSKAEG